MLTINITPTMLTFKKLSDEMYHKLKHVEKLEIEYNEKGYYYIKDKPEKLYKILLQLAYTYDIEII